ncbi:integrase [Opitutaceae bacterium TAV5]|nr:integrase [Opitutaceae bacterium TAV5]
MKKSLENETTRQSQKSGQEVGKNSAAPTTTHGSLARLKQRIQRNTRKYYGADAAPQYLIRIQCRRHREWFELGADLDAAAKLAREIDQHLRLHGWDATRKKFKPAFESELCDLTVGGYIAIVAQHGQLHPMTLNGYAALFRRIAASIRGITLTGTDKYTGGRKPSKWRQMVDKILLNTITPERVVEWRDAYVARRPAGTEARVRVEHTANSFIRNARSLFAKRVLKRVLTKCPNLALPDPLPFAGVELLSERESDFFYISEVDAKQLIEDAFKELSGNQIIIFILAIGAGMRRNEIDKLPWSHVDLPSGTVTVAPTKYSRLKSDSSVGKIQLEPRFAEKLREHAAENRGEFVLPSVVPARQDSPLRHYRCMKDFTALCAWLKTKGITRSVNRIHTLRKEFGSHIAQRRGIFAASSGLRHSTIGVTRKFYVSSKIDPTSFFATETATAAAAQDATKLVELLQKALEQGAIKLPVAPAA